MVATFLLWAQKANLLLPNSPPSKADSWTFAIHLITMMSMNMKVKMSGTPVEELRLLLIMESLDLVMWQYMVFCEVLYCWQMLLGRPIPMPAHVTDLDVSNNSLSQHRRSQSSYENRKAQSKTLTKTFTSSLLGSPLSPTLSKSKTIFRYVWISYCLHMSCKISPIS